MIVGEIEENDDKVRSVYGGSVEQAACRNLARSCAPKPGRVPKPGRAPVTARRGPARRDPARPHGEVRSGPARPSAARPGPARAGGGRETGKTDSTTVEITCAWRRMTDRARRIANFWKQIEKTTKSYPSTGDQFCESRKTQSSTRRTVFSGVCRARGVTTTLSRKPNGRARHLANFRKIEETD